MNTRTIGAVAAALAFATALAVPAAAEVWTPNGVTICTYDVVDLQMVSDDNGGAILAWIDDRTMPNGSIYAQRIDDAGNTYWPYNGAAVWNAPDIYPGAGLHAAPDGAGGILCAWVEFDTDTTAVIKAQRLDEFGAQVWASTGVEVNNSIYYSGAPRICSDENGGAFVAFLKKFEEGGPHHVYAQHLNFNGGRTWGSGGVVVCDVTMLTHPSLGGAFDMQVLPDHAGGMIVIWVDDRTPPHLGFYVDLVGQRLNGSGVPQWTTNGRAICAAAWGQILPRMVDDGVGGWVIAWRDGRTGTGWDLYAQRIDIDGDGQWTSGGVAVCDTAGTDSDRGHDLAADGAGNTVFTWVDGRTSINGNDVYVQKLDISGNPVWAENGKPVSENLTQVEYPRCVSDGAGGAIVAWTDWRNLLDTGPDIYAQRVDSDGWNMWAPDGKATCTDAGVQSGVVAVSNGNGGAIIAWEGSVGAQRWKHQLFDAPTGVAGEHRFDVSHQLVAVDLQWDANDEFIVSDYAIHRSDSIDFDPGPATLIATTTETSHTDSLYSWSPQLQFYKIAARDADGIEGPYTTLEWRAITGVTTPVIAGTWLAPNVPNPFNPRTTIRFGLRAAGAVALVIYDAAGRRVRTLVDGTLDAGPHTETWDGTDARGVPVASGIYFCRLESGDTIVSRKMVLLK